MVKAGREAIMLLINISRLLQTNIETCHYADLMVYFLLSQWTPLSIKLSKVVQSRSECKNGYEATWGIKYTCQKYQKKLPNFPERHANRLRRHGPKFARGFVLLRASLATWKGSDMPLSFLSPSLCATRWWTLHNSKDSTPVSSFFPFPPLSLTLFLSHSFFFLLFPLPLLSGFSVEIFFRCHTHTHARTYLRKRKANPFQKWHGLELDSGETHLPITTLTFLPWILLTAR